MHAKWAGAQLSALDNREITLMIRIEWRIGRGSGHGNWFNSSERSMLQTHVDDANKRYGAGTHKIATAVP